MQNFRKKVLCTLFSTPMWFTRPPARIALGRLWPPRGCCLIPWITLWFSLYWRGGGGSSLAASESPAEAEPTKSSEPIEIPVIPIWTSIQWTKEYQSGSLDDPDEDDEQIAYFEVNWTHGLQCEEPKKPSSSKRHMCLTIRKQLKHHQKSLKKYGRSLKLDVKKVESPGDQTAKDTPHVPNNSSSPSATGLRNPDEQFDSRSQIFDDELIPNEELKPDDDNLKAVTQDVPSLLKDRIESLRKTILQCRYYRDKYLKRLKTIALTARQKITAQPELVPPVKSPRTFRPSSVHDPEVEQDCRAFSDLEGIVQSWFQSRQGLPDWDFLSTSHRKMEAISQDINWLS